MRLIMGVSFGVALSFVIFAGSELFTGNNMVFAIGKLKDRVGIGFIIKLFAFCFIGNLFGSILLAWLVVQGGSLSLDRSIDSKSRLYENVARCQGSFLSWNFMQLVGMPRGMDS
jgi:formate/nitrite transporter FocA (FNT family)